jgi:hypothetical protein
MTEKKERNVATTWTFGEMLHDLYTIHVHCQKISNLFVRALETARSVHFIYLKR